MTSRSGALALFTSCLLAGACGPKGDAKTTAPPPRPSAAPAGPRVAVVEGSVMLKDCPAKIDKKQSEKTMNGLVEGCDKVPGGSARFLATLEPGGRVEVSAPDGSNEGTIPICVLKNKLRHKVQLTKPCTVEVQIEERSVRGPPPAK